MKHLIVILLITAAVASLSMATNERKINLAPAVKSIGELSLAHINSLDSFLQTYPAHFYDSSYEVRQKKYKELAYYFKKAAGFIIYFEQELYYKKLIAPFQFQQNGGRGILSVVPDNWLFTGPIGNEHDTSLVKFYSRQDSADNAGFIKKVAGNYRKSLAEGNFAAHLSNLNESALFDALRLEIFRISSIDLANADFIIEEAGLPSLNGSLLSWLILTDELVRALPASKQDLQQSWQLMQASTNQYLDLNRDFNKFDRMFFTQQHLIPLSSYLNQLQVAMKVPFLKKKSALRSDAMHLYDKNIFVADYFAPNEQATYTAARATLGELLFFDPVLSGNNQRACASCHKPSMAFTDGKIKSVGFDFEEVLSRNSPTVINSGFQKKLFWDQRAAALEDQLDSVVNNAHELNGSFTSLIEKLSASPEYVLLFKKAYPHTAQEGISRADIKNAIGAYERTVTGMNSRFDAYMQGDASKLSNEEVNGFNVYMGKARCGNCHFAPLFNGDLPPFFDRTDHKSLGVPLKDSMNVYELDPDVGVYKPDNNIFSRFSFKTPTVRNAALTAPYMHNGVYQTLEQVVNFYDHAGGEKFLKDFSNIKPRALFTFIPLELKLTAVEKRDLVAFMKALTDTSASKTPQRLPVLKGKYAKLNKRIIGGEY